MINITEINRNFIIRFIINNKSRLIGAGTFINFLGEELAGKLIERAYNHGKDKCRCKLRRGIIIDLYVH